ncbi:DUF2459 domain-containing protein [Alphaproteobacteria bacterium]|nr:DUF2459 domain-containing protein [Alphaproteobacteria bacterium]
MYRSIVLIIQLLVFFGAIASSDKPSAKERDIYLISTGWHTGIAVPVDTLLKRNLPESLDFREIQYLEIGWGDRVFYQSPNPSYSALLNALLKPTSSVIHVYGFNHSIETTFRNSKIVKLTLNETEYTKLLYFIHKSFTRNVNGKAQLEGVGLYGKNNSFFYMANGEFHLFNTCNTWVASAIQSTGIGLDSTGIVTADNLLKTVRYYIDNN